MFADNTDDTIYDLQSGRTDAALVRADVIAHTDERGVINASSFKFLSAVCLHLRNQNTVGYKNKVPL